MSVIGHAVAPTGQRPAPGRARRRRRPGARRITMLLTIAPAVILMLVFLGVPVAQGIQMSLSSWPGFGPMEFVGLDNYRDALFDSPFVSALGLTGVFALLSTAGIMIIAALLAAAVSGRVRGYRFYRVVWFLPGIAPVAAMGVFWSTAFQPHQGAVNAILGLLNLGSDHAWLADPSTAIYPPIFVTIWAGAGFAFLLILGAMEQIPVSTYESARLDGAGTARIFFSITLPLIRPVFAITSVLELIWHFNSFTAIWAMTQGGPGFSTSVLPVLIYREGFQLIEFGSASAMAVMGGAILVIVGLFTVRLSRSRQEES